MKLIGLTGGIGMGKSAAAEILRARGVAVVDTDELARELTAPGQSALAEIQKEFGAQILVADGKLNRAALASFVFADETARKKLEAILHPRIRERWLAQVAVWRAEQKSIAVVVIPLLFETSAETQFDRIVCVACSPATQSARLAARGWAPAQIAARNAAQWPVQRKMDAA
ncbi:MAG: dephospho-CoA kinase, partial [Verrucomicrobiota bacterium]